jgi:fatty-acyl-CoA synthase
VNRESPAKKAIPITIKETDMQPESSYVHGASDLPLIGKPIGAYLDAIAARFGDNDALIVPHQGIHWTYREFNGLVSRLAAGLLKLGIPPGARVGIWSQNCAEWC